MLNQNALPVHMTGGTTVRAEPSAPTPRQPKAREAKAIPARPIIIDERDGPCEICAARQVGICDKCGLDGQTDGGMTCGKHNDHTKWIGANGFESPRPTHYHLEIIADANGRRAYWSELCYNCYQAEYQAVYGIDPFAR